ncbi:hypothetical protein AJ88_31185 [Mesorhizobium amorphae CCBAU 01583]|nr:hypothetical protein AJ88_31185 [Mesorhizobium amorphae CCBAU 01583]
MPNGAAGGKLLKVEDDGITDPGIHARIIARSKQLLGYEGITHPNGEYEPGLDAARYVNAFPGTPGDYRAWVGGIREPEDIVALLENLQYAYLRAKIVVLEEELAKNGVTFEAQAETGGGVRKDDPARAYAVLIADLVGLRFGADGQPDHSEIKAYIEEKGGVFHLGPLGERSALEKGRIHFFYQPDLSTEAEILPQTDKGQYDALIAAATFIPKASVFPLGGVRIGAGTGNMGSASWGGGNGEGGEAPLMNTPGINSRATAQMAMKAILRVVPDLPVDRLHRMVAGGDFDTGRQLKDFPTAKLEGRKIAILGYGNIGREVAKLAKAFGMKVAIYAREHHKRWIEAEVSNCRKSDCRGIRRRRALCSHRSGPPGCGERCLFQCRNRRCEGARRDERRRGAGQLRPGRGRRCRRARRGAVVRQDRACGDRRRSLQRRRDRQTQRTDASLPAARRAP